MSSNDGDNGAMHEIEDGRNQRQPLPQMKHRGDVDVETVGRVERGGWGGQTVDADGDWGSCGARGHGDAVTRAHHKKGRVKR